MSYSPLVIPELTILGVAHPGVPNEERVVVRPTESVQLGEFGIAVGLFVPETGGARPLFDNVFWFPNHVLAPPAWILVYTGKGEPKQTMLPSGETVVTLFWQRAITVFDGPNVVPVLFRLGGAVVGPRL